MTVPRLRIVAAVAIVVAAALTAPAAVGEGAPYAGLDPYGVLGSAVSTQVQLQAGNLGGSTPYDVVFDQTVLTSVTSTRSGTVDVTLTLPTAACGDHPVSLDDPATEILSLIFRVLKATSGTSFVVPSP